MCPLPSEPPPTPPGRHWASGWAPCANRSFPLAVCFTDGLLINPFPAWFIENWVLLPPRALTVSGRLRQWARPSRAGVASLPSCLHLQHTVGIQQLLHLCTDCQLCLGPSQGDIMLLSIVVLLLPRRQQSGQIVMIWLSHAQLPPCSMKGLSPLPPSLPTPASSAGCRPPVPMTQTNQKPGGELLLCL